MGIILLFITLLILWLIGSYFTYSYAEKHSYTEKPLNRYGSMSVAKTIHWNLYSKDNAVLAICTFLFLTSPGFIFVVLIMPFLTMILN